MKLINFFLTNALFVVGIAAGLPAVAQVNESFEHGLMPCGVSGPGGVGAHPMPPIGMEHGQHGGPMRMDGPPPMHDMPMRNVGMPPFFHDLKLSEAQEDKIFAIRHANEPVLHEQHKLAKKSADAIRDMSDGTAPYDEVKIKALADTYARAVAQIMVVHTSTGHQLSAVLTPEQRAQAKAAMGQHEKCAAPNSPMH